MQIAVITSQFNHEITLQLKEGCINRLSEKLTSFQNFSVPGAIELVYASKQIANTKKFDAIIVLGAIIKGHTDHYEYVCNFVTHGIGLLATFVETPIIFGILTTQNEELAIERADINKMNKGLEFADAAIEMANFKLII